MYHRFMIAAVSIQLLCAATSPAQRPARDRADATHPSAATAVAGSAVPAALLPDPLGNQMVRVISFVIPAENAGANHSVRVQLTSLHHPPAPPTYGTPPNFTGLEGEYRYLNSFSGGVINCPDSVTFGTGYFCAQLGCEPEYRDWASDLASPPAGYPQEPGLIFVFGSSVVPSSTYDASVIAEACGPASSAASCDEASDALSLATSRWGDTSGPGSAQPDGAVNTIDLNFVRGKQVLDQVPEYRAWLEGRRPMPATGSIIVVDLGLQIDAVKGFAYPANQQQYHNFYIEECP